jgi:hypothetical protein
MSASPHYISACVAAAISAATHAGCSGDPDTGGSELRISAIA